MSEGRLEVEVQIAKPTSDPTGMNGQASEHLETGESVDLMSEASKLTPETMELIQRLLDGTEAYGRDLKAWEVQKFNPIHINVCVLRAAGFRGVEIAKILDLQQTTVSLTLTHPYGIKLVGALVPRSAVKVFDIKTRLEEQASELLDHVYSLAMKSEEVKDVANVTFGILDRAGYQPKSNTSSKEIPGSFSMQESTMKRLERAMEGSAMVNKEVMPHWVPRKPPDEGSLPADDSVGLSVQDNAAHVPAPQQDGQQVAAGGRR